MWLLFRDLWFVRRPPASSRGAILLALLALLAPASMAADVHIQPGVELRAETHSNRSLEAEGEKLDETSYRLNLSALFGVRTPLSETVLRPRIQMQYNPDREDEERIDAFLDLRTGYRSQRSSFDLAGTYRHQDLADAELANAEFDDINPDDPTAPQTGRAVIGQSRDMAQIRPRYTYSVTERVRVGAGATYEIVQYDSDEALRSVDYDYTLGDGFLIWTFDPETDVTFGGYASRYEANGVQTTDAVGVRLGIARRWSPTLQSMLDLSYEENDLETIDVANPAAPAFERTTTGWGVLFTLVQQDEISSWRVRAGRIFTPGGEGVKKESDQIQLQYRRQLAERLDLTTAVRFNQDRPIGVSDSLNFQEYARAELSLRWLMSPTWYVSGGYRYTWEDLRSEPDSADDHALFLSFGYLALGPAGG